ncbi:MAG TPA: hypothetical protein VMR31_02950 [Myxococcota bacterium]|nr:hypothetical protein [Myxococcota bacterium]
MKLRRAAFAVVLAGALGLATLLLLEAGVRVFQPQVLPHDVPELWVEDAALGWRHRPNVDLWQNSGEREVEVCTDAAGNRVACRTPARSDCRARVLAVGDSYAEALAVPFEQTVWARLDADTGACTDDTGVSAYDLAQYVATVRQRLAAPGAHYDLVIVSLYLGNDLTAEPDRMPEPQTVKYRPVRLFPAALTEQALWDWFYPWNSWLESHSQLYVAARFAIRRFRDPGHVGVYGVPDVVRPSRFGAELRDGTARGIAELAEAAHEHGARVLVSVVPHVVQVRDPDGAELLRGLPKLRGDVDMDLASREFVPQLARVPGVDRVVDLLPALRAARGEPVCGTRDTHLSPAGHAVWFEAIRAPARELLGLPAR